MKTLSSIQICFWERTETLRDSQWMHINENLDPSKCVYNEFHVITHHNNLFTTYRSSSYNLYYSYYQFFIASKLRVHISASIYTYISPNEESWFCCFQTSSQHIFLLRWHPAVYHFCPLFTSQCLDNKLSSLSSHWHPHKIKELSRFFSLC